MVPIELDGSEGFGTLVDQSLRNIGAHKRLECLKAHVQNHQMVDNALGERAQAQIEGPIEWGSWGSPGPP